jgi:hypothetical protein
MILIPNYLILLHMTYRLRYVETALYDDASYILIDQP